MKHAPRVVQRSVARTAPEINEKTVGDNAWRLLRAAIAQEYVEKLAEQLTLADMVDLLRISKGRVVELILAGDIVSQRVSGEIVIFPRDNLDFFSRAMLTHLRRDAHAAAAPVRPLFAVTEL